MSYLEAIQASVVLLALLYVMACIAVGVNHLEERAVKQGRRSIPMKGWRFQLAVGIRMITAILCGMLSIVAFVVSVPLLPHMNDILAYMVCYLLALPMCILFIVPMMIGDKMLDMCMPLLPEAKQALSYTG